MAANLKLVEGKESNVDRQKALDAAGKQAEITTEIQKASKFYHAEEYHQQYLAKNPSGYCGIGGTGVSCPAAPRS